MNLAAGWRIAVLGILLGGVGRAPCAAQSAVILHVATVDNTEPGQTHVDEPLLNDFEGTSYPLVVGFRNPAGGSGVANPDDFDIFWNGIDNRWAISNRSGDVPLGATFVVWVPRPLELQLPGLGATYRHLMTVANTTGAVTTLSHPLLDGHPEARVQAHWGGGGFFLATAPAAFYDGAASRWKVRNQDGSNLPVPTWVHVGVDRCGLGRDAATVELATVDCAAPDGATCVADLSAPRGFLPMFAALDAGVLDDHPIAAYWDEVGESWDVINEDAAAMPAGADFFAAFSSLIFEHGFDGGTSRGWIAVP